jgi:hypothetical protein
LFEKLFDMGYKGCVKNFLDPVREKVTHKDVKKKRIGEEIFNRGKINGLKLKRQHKPGLAFPKTFEFA